jgi:hypothetical protein
MNNNTTISPVTLLVICDLLMSFSSISISPIRDAITQACLTICDILLKHVVEIRQQIDIASRQLAGIKRNENRAKYDTVAREKLTIEQV